MNMVMGGYLHKLPGNLKLNVCSSDTQFSFRCNSLHQKCCNAIFHRNYKNYIDRAKV